MEMLVELTDEGLLRDGDTAGLVRRHYGAVRRLLGAEGARDAAQETFVRAIAHLEEFDRRRSFRNWLFAIAANYVRDHLRRRKQLPLDPGLEDSVPDLSLPD